jgi:hypothetical protein
MALNQLHVIYRLADGQHLPDLTAVKGLFAEALDLKREPTGS